MASLALDTYDILQRLLKKGYSQQQAEGFLEVMQQIDLDHLATKADIKDVRSEIRESELRLTIRLGGMIMALGGILIAIKYFG